MERHYLRGLLLLSLLVSMSATALATRRTSTTFDEITAIGGGARGFHTGSFAMTHDYPPVTQYLYGLPVVLSGINYPAEVHRDTVPHRYDYAQQLLWSSGNNADRIIFLARLMTVLCVGVLVVLTDVLTSRSFGAVAGLLAAAMVAFLPDVLAHGGIAYNDLPLAPAFLAALIAVDVALRKPTLARGALAGALVSLALGIKHSALALGPAAIVLFIIELAARENRREWLPRALVSTAVALVVGYVVQVAIYQGDFSLAFLRASTFGATRHIAAGHGVPAYLLGQMRTDAWWYFYPVAFLFKTPVALQALIVLSVLGLVRALRGQSRRQLLAAPARPYVIGVLVFGAILLRANLTIGFRYALPLLPLICILTAAGLAVVWRTSGKAFRVLIGALVVWSAGSALSFYPHFITYTSEHQPARERGYEVFVDSSLDWGQGLVELRDFMREESIPRVYLSYFGSALPEGYGIDYIPLPSFFPLPYRPMPETDLPRYAAISATNLVGLYFIGGDPYAALRAREPYRVLGNSIHIYDVSE